MKKRKMTRQDIKRIIRKGTKLQIDSAIFKYWKLEGKCKGWLPYKDD